MGLLFKVRSSGCFKMGSFLWMNLSFSKKVHNITLPPKTLKNKLQKNVLTHNENKELKKVMKSKLKKKGRKSNHSKKKDYELKNTTENFKEKVYLESMVKLHCHVCYPLLV